MLCSDLEPLLGIDVRCLLQLGTRLELQYWQVVVVGLIAVVDHKPSIALPYMFETLVLIFQAEVVGEWGCLKAPQISFVVYIFDDKAEVVIEGAVCLEVWVLANGFFSWHIALESW
jgi:hypothetical protein